MKKEKEKKEENKREEKRKTFFNMMDREYPPVREFQITTSGIVLPWPEMK